jgi:hypothetical protein
MPSRPSCFEEEETVLTQTGLTVQVKRITLSEIETNVDEVLAYVEERVKDYDPAKYVGDADTAKKDRAELNKADKRMLEMAKELTDQIMAPLAPILEKLKRGRSLIKVASQAVDTLVKAKEAEEDEKKRNQITEYWNTRNFDLVPLERFFDPRWLNKGASLSKEVYPAIDAKIKEIYESIKTIEDVGGEDVEVMKSEYIRTLDLGAAIRRGKELKEDRERLAREKAARPEREVTEQVNAQTAELYHEEVAEQHAEPVRSLASAALGETIPDPATERVTYVMEFTGTRAALFALREYMNKNRITYKVIEKTA